MHRSLLLLPAVVALLISGCGWTWAPVVGSTSGSSSSPAPLKILSTTPVDGDLAAEPGSLLDPRIEINFNFDIDGGTLHSGTIGIAADGDPTNLFDELVTSIDTNGAQVLLRLAHPLRLLSEYEVTVTRNVLSTGGRRLKQDQVLGFTIRDGTLTDQAIVSFLQPIGAVRLLPDLRAVTVIEGVDIGASTTSTADDVFRIAAAEEVQPGGPWGVPTILKDVSTLTQSAQGGTFVGGGTISVAWLEGRPNCGGINCFRPEAHLYVSQRLNGVWEVDPPALDAAIVPSSPIYEDLTVSWKPQIHSTEDGTTVAVWWAWRDFFYTDVPSDAPPACGSEPIHKDGEFARWEVYSAVRRVTQDANGNPVPFDWEPAQRVSPPDLEFGWPLIADQPGADRIYALWGEGATKSAVFDPYADPAAQPPLSGLLRYWVAEFENGAWGMALPLAANATSGLPRPTGFVVTADGRAVILGRSAAEGPVAFVADLAGLQLLDAVPLDSSGGTELAPDQVSFEPCSQFNFIRSDVADQFPRAFRLPGTSANTVLVTWFRDEGPAGSSFWASDFDVDLMQWVKSEQVVGPQVPTSFGDVSFQGGLTAVDGNGTVTTTWQIEELVNGISVAAEVQGARRVAGLWNPIPGSSQGLFTDPQTPFGQTVSEPGHCSSGATIAGDERTGQVIIGWTELECGSSPQVPVVSIFRRLE